MWGGCTGVITGNVREIPDARAYTVSVEIMIKHSVGGGVVRATVGRCVRDATMLFLYLLIYA